MRSTALTLGAALLCGAAVLAQQPPAQAPPAPNDNAALNQILQNWEQVMTTINTLVVQCNRTTVDKTWDRTEVFEGEAKFLKPSRASLEMHNKAKPEVFEKYVCNGASLWVYNPQGKQLRVHKLPPTKSGQVSDDNFLSFLFGMKATQAKLRYDLKLLPSPANDNWYYYIEIQPRERADKADFTRARLVLTRMNFLPRQLWFEQPNGNEVTWDFNKLLTAVDLRPAEFDQPAPPPGWQLVPGDAPGPQAPAARVIRQQQ